MRRRYISAAQQVAELAWNRRKDMNTVKQRAEALVLGASTDTLTRRAVLSPSEWTEHLMDYLGQARTGGLAGVSTGLRDLDTMTLGLSPALYLLAASTGTGKTALAGQIALHIAEHHGPVVFVSMELADVDLAVRLVSVITNIKKEQLVTASSAMSSRVVCCRRSISYHSRACTWSSAPGTRARMCAPTRCRFRRPKA
jgi:replicative DNA helicase